jgi:hypothetical protein
LAAVRFRDHDRQIDRRLFFAALPHTAAVEPFCAWDWAAVGGNAEPHICQILRQNPQNTEGSKISVHNNTFSYCIYFSFLF